MGDRFGLICEVVVGFVIIFLFDFCGWCGGFQGGCGSCQSTVG